MANKLYEESSVSAIADAIRRKNGQATTYTVAEMAPAIDAISTGYTITNGVKQQYMADSTTIPADTFVEFVRNATAHPTKITDTQVVSSNPTFAAAVKLSDTTVFVAYTSSSTLYGVVCTVSGSSITVGTSVVIPNGSSNTNIALIGANKVFVVYRHTGANGLYGAVCTISGTTVSVGTEASITSRTNSHADIATLEDDKVIIVEGNTSSPAGLYGIVCTVSGTTITAGTETVIVSGSAYMHCKVLALDSSTVFVTNSASSVLNAIICTISGTTITVGTNTTIDSREVAFTFNRPVLIGPNKVFLAFCPEISSRNILNGIVCTVSGTTITAGTAATLPSSTISVFTNVSAVCLADDSVAVGFSGGSSHALYYSLCTVNGSNITVNTTTNSASYGNNSGDYISLVSLDGNTVFTPHKLTQNSNNKFYVGISTMYDISLTVQASVDKIDGVAAEQITTSAAGDVWVLNNNS